MLLRRIARILTIGFVVRCYIAFIVRFRSRIKAMLEEVSEIRLSGYDSDAVFKEGKYPESVRKDILGGNFRQIYFYASICESMNVVSRNPNCNTRIVLDYIAYPPEDLVLKDARFVLRVLFRMYRMIYRRGQLMDSEQVVERSRFHVRYIISLMRKTRVC